MKAKTTFLIIQFINFLGLITYLAITMSFVFLESGGLLKTEKEFKSSITIKHQDSPNYKSFTCKYKRPSKKIY